MQHARILVLADDPIIRAGLNVILAEDDTLDVVGQAAFTQLNEDLLDAFLPEELFEEGTACA